MLKLDLRPGDQVDIDNGRIVVRLEQKSGQLARISFQADRSIPIRLVEKAHDAAEPARQGLAIVG